MSKSYKRFPVVKDKTGPAKRFAKQLASKAVRRYHQDIHHGRMYRKVFCSWMINDFWFYKTLRETLHTWERSKFPRDLEKSRKQIINEWAKHYYRK